MIKRFLFVRRSSVLSVREFSAAWVDLVARATDAPWQSRPQRVVACVTRHDVAGTETPHDGIAIAWFVDEQALRRFDAWLDETAAQQVAAARGWIDPRHSEVVVAHEHVMRGADWLAQRWRGDSAKAKHMALARRAEGLSSTAFSTRWRGRPGTVGGAGSAPAIVIPERAKGHAYVQNHPLLDVSTPWAYDAINEVYFDDVEAMASRIAFFREHDVGRADADLVSKATFVAVDEYVIRSSMTSQGGEL